MAREETAQYQKQGEACQRSRSGLLTPVYLSEQSRQATTGGHSSQARPRSARVEYEATF